MPDLSSSAAQLLARARGRRGLALVTVLWVLMLLSLVAASFTRTTRVEVNLTRNQIENARAEALADAGVYRAVLGLLEARTEGLVDADGEGLSRLSVARRKVTHLGLEGGLRAELDAGNLAPETVEAVAEGWRTDGTVYAWDFGGEVRISIQDEGGKIDLNAAPDELLRRLFLSAEWTDPDGAVLGLGDSEADALVDAVRDFADEDDLTRLNGAEDGDYESAGLPWGAKDAPFEAIEELQQVLGMTLGLYEAVEPALTVYTQSEGIDPAKAPRAVLLALAGGETESVDEFLAARAQAPEGAGPAFLAAEGTNVGSRGRVFMIHAEGRMAGGAVFAREAVVRLGGGERGFTVEAWKQGRRALFGADEDVAVEDAAQ